ncbi:MAG: uroporphyrinogen-III C-methyltransferase [Flavobacteriales bacterium]
MIELKINGSAPKVTLVGAGPGALDLITLRGINAIKSAQVILYDALVDKRMLDHAPKAKKVFVGKRKGYKRFSQEELNELIVHYAVNYGNVVRLKGGDSFVFGRGTEEMTYAAAFGIETEVVPGLSSVTSVPASAGVPVTHRNVARSFWALTGTSSNGVINQDLSLAAKSTATIVVLMGMSKLNEIVSIFSTNGKSNTPVSVIQNGTTEREKIGVGTVSTITEVVKRKKLSSPAIIIIGEVVKESLQFAEFFQKALPQSKKAS